jgi:hypothetical protein
MQGVDRKEISQTTQILLPMGRAGNSGSPGEQFDPEVPIRLHGCGIFEQDGTDQAPFLAAIGTCLPDREDDGDV